MEYNSQSQDSHYVSRRKYRRNLMEKRVNGYLSNPESDGFFMDLYLSEIMQMKKKYPNLSIRSKRRSKRLFDGYHCKIKRKKNA